jgi:hypothetical protein
LREERKKAKKNKDKYVGIDSDCITSSHSRSGGFSDFSKSGFGSSDFKSNTISELDDKEWRSNNPSFQERISDITSKVKTILDTPPTKENNLDISDDDNDLGIRNDISPNSQKSQVQMKSKIDLNVSK